MHLPDGFLDGKTALLTSAASLAGVGMAVHRLKKTLPPRQTPMLGLSAAFIFAAQMVNFPVVAGTSGHLVGGVLAAVLLGPAAAVVVLACVLVVQCLMFNDGGLLALGANVFNMALVNGAAGYLLFMVLRRLVPLRGDRAVVFAAVMAAWAGTVAAAFACGVEMACSGTVAWGVAIPAMVNIHLLIGIGEGALTGLVVAAVLRSRRELVAAVRGGGEGQRRGLVRAGLPMAFGLALFGAPFACPWPDGLEAVARRLGFEHRALLPSFPSPLADYHLPWIGSVGLATATAGAVGTLTAFLGAWWLAARLVPPTAAGKDDAPAAP